MDASSSDKTCIFPNWQPVAYLERRNSYAHQRETSGSIQFRNANFYKRIEFDPRGCDFFPLRTIPYGMESLLPH